MAVVEGDGARVIDLVTSSGWSKETFGIQVVLAAGGGG